MSNQRSEPPAVVESTEERVLLLVAGERDRDLLADRLAERYEVVDGDPDDLGEFDLCIVDAPTYRRVAEDLSALKGDTETYLPVLLLVEDRQRVQEAEWLAEEVGGTVDDVLVIPTPKHELDARVEALLRARRQSRRLALFRRAMDEATTGISITDPNRPDNPMVYVNDGFCRITGYDREAVLGRNCRFLQGPDTEAATVDRIRAAIDAEEPVTVELLNYRADGEPFWNLLTIAPVRGKDGEVTHFLGFQRDITERVRSEREVRRERQRFEALAQTATDAIVITDADSVVRYANPAVERVFGYEPREVEGERLTKLIPEPFRERHAEGFQQHLETGRRTLEWDMVRFSGLHADGHEVPLEVSLAEFEGPDGPLFAGIVRDITEREALESELRAERELLEQVFDTSPVGIAVIDTDGDIVRANETAQRELGLERSEITSRTFDDPEWEIFDADGEPIPSEELPPARVLRTGEPVEDYRHGIRVDGEERWLSVNSAPLTGEDGDVESVVSAVRNITDRVERERELERYETLVETMTDAAWVFDADGRITLADRKFMARVPLPWDDAIGRHVTEFEPMFADAETFQEYHGLLEDILDGRLEEASIDAGFEAPDGTLVANLRLAPIPGPDGPSGAAVVARDITDRVERERELERYETVVRTMEAGAWVINADRRLSFANDTVADLLSVEAEQFHGTHIDDARYLFAEASDFERYRDHVDRLLAGRGEQASLDVTFSLSDERMVANLRLASIPGEDGPTGVVVVANDVTDRAERERELERYETIVQTTTDPIYVVDREGCFVRVNDALVEASGYDREELLGSHVSMIADEETVERTEAVIRDLLEDGRDQATIEAPMVFADGTRRVFSTSLAVLRDDDGDLVGTVIAAHDVTDLRGHQRRLSVLDRVLRHNLRNRMNIVTGYAGELATHPDPEVARLGAAIEESAIKLLELSESARKFESVISGTAEQTTTMDLADSVATAVEDVRAEHPWADVVADLPGAAFARAHETFELAIEELLTNAVTHSDREDPTVEVSVTTGPDWVRVSVADDGPGIDDIDRRALMSGTESPLEHTQGLGLWLVRWTVESVGGTLDIADNDPRGTVVTVSLPLAPG